MSKVNAGCCRTVHYVILAALQLRSKTLPTYQPTVSIGHGMMGLLCPSKAQWQGLRVHLDPKPEIPDESYVVRLPLERAPHLLAVDLFLFFLL